MKIAALSTVALALAAALGSAQAQSAGSLIVKLGVNNIDPHVKSGDLSEPSLPGTKIDVKSATSAIISGTYMVTDHVSVETFIGLPYKHDVVGAGTIASAGKIATIKQVSPTLLAQYRFLDAASPMRPYVGVGPTYAYFFKEEGTGTLTAMTNPGGAPTHVSVDSAWGTSFVAGGTFQLKDHWGLDASVVKTFIKTTTHLSTGQHIDTKLDPISVNVSLTYRY
jgi:outer membrane protein